MKQSHHQRLSRKKEEGLSEAGRGVTFQPFLFKSPAHLQNTMNQLFLRRMFEINE